MEQNMNKGYDLFLFAGQSNMAGRGITSERFHGKTPAVLKGAGVVLLFWNGFPEQLILPIYQGGWMPA